MKSLEFAVSLEDHVSPSASKAGAAIRQLGNDMGEAKLKIHDTGEGFLKVVEPIEVMKDSLKDVGAGFSEFASALRSGNIEGAIDGLTEALAGAAKMLDLIVPGLGEAAAAAIKFGGAMAGTTVGLVETALEVTAVNDKLEQTFQALARGPEAGKKTLDFLNRLSHDLPQSRDELAKWTKQFQALGVTDLGELEKHIRAAASAQAIMGDEGAAAYTKITERVHVAIEEHKGLKLAEKSLKSLYDAGVNVTDIADRMGLTTKQLAANLKAGTIDAEKFGDALSNTL